jgi:hypothetical protein
MSDRNFNRDYAKYFEDDTNAAEWLNNLMHRVYWKMFENQEEWIYMLGELESDKPCLKDNFFEYAEMILDEELSLFKACVLTGMAYDYIDDDIDVTENIAYELNEWQGIYDGDEDEYLDSMRVHGIVPKLKK